MATQRRARPALDRGDREDAGAAPTSRMRSGADVVDRRGAGAPRAPGGSRRGCRCRTPCRDRDRSRPRRAVRGVASPSSGPPRTGGVRWVTLKYFFQASRHSASGTAVASADPRRVDGRRRCAGQRGDRVARLGERGSLRRPGRPRTRPRRRAARCRRAAGSDLGGEQRGDRRRRRRADAGTTISTQSACGSLNRAGSHATGAAAAATTTDRAAARPCRSRCAGP